MPKGRLTWYNPVERDRTSLFQIQPNRDDITAEQAIVDILALRFEPHRTNGFPERTRNNQGGFAEPSWAGLTQYLNGFDLSRSKFLELWVRGNAGKLHIDLGELSERVSLPLDHPVHNPPPSNRLRTEDKPLGGLPTGDNVATVEEDIGLDGLTDAQEDSVFRLIYPAISVPDDPSGDNFSDIDIRADATLDRYPPQVNGTEGNSPERDSTPDTEDLNRNGILDTRDNYVRYSVDLSTNRGLNPNTGEYDGPSVLVDGTVSDVSEKPWRLVRIPLRGRTAPQTQEGTPDTTFASVVDYARLWIEHNDSTTIQIYTMDVAGSDWLEDPVPPDQQSGDFKVAVIGTDNAVYESPPGLERETDPASGRRLLERSLALKFENLYPGESVSASRTFFQEEDYTQYGKLTMFVHGGNPASPTYNTNFPALEDTVGGLISPIEIFLRFTSISGDTLNLYEYRSRVYRGWAPEANTVEVDLELVSQLKGQLLDLKAAGQLSSDSLSLSLKGGEYRARYDKEMNTIEIDSDGRSYIVRGNPALSRIRAFTVGIRNTGDPDLGDPVLEGESEVWLDELRVDDIRKRRAMSASLNLHTVLADLGNLSVSMERRSGDFQDLQGRATGTTTSGIRLDGQINLDKFLPETWYMSIPVRLSYNRHSSVPRIRTGSDIVLTSEQKVNESDVRSSSRFNLSLRKRPAPDKPTLLARVFFDRINASLNYSTNSTVGGAITRRRANSSDNLNGNFGYDVNWPTRKSLPIFGWIPWLKTVKESEFFFLPSSLGYSARFNRSVRDQRSFSAVAGDTSDVVANINETFSLNENYKIKLAPFRSLTADYDLTVDRDLRNGFTFTQFQFGRETRRNQRVAFGFSPRLTRYFTLNTQYSSTYAEDLETGGQKTPLGNVRRGLKVNNNNTANVRVSLNLPTIFQPLARPGKSGGISIRRIIGKLGSSLDALQSSASRSRSNNLFGLRSRPSFKFQMGLRDTAEVEVYPSAGVTRINSRNITDRAGLSGGLRLPLGLSVQAGTNYTHTWTYGNANTEDENIVLPTISAAWRGLERVPVLKWILTSSSLNASYQDVRTRRGEGGLGPQTLTSDGTKADYNPLIAWTARWKGQLSTTLRSNQSRQSDLRYQRNIADTSAAQPALQDRLIGTTIDERSALQANLGYTLQFFERLKSNVDIDLGFTTSSELQKELPRSTSPEEAVEPVIRRHEGIWSASLAAQYQFSSQFTGGARLRHENRRDRLRDLTNRSWEFRLWGEIRFN